MEQRISWSLSAGMRILLPASGALGLTLVLWGLYPPEMVDTGIRDPAVLAGLFLAAHLWYASHSLLPPRLVSGLPVSLFGLANTVTLLRGALYAVVAGFVVVPPDSNLVWVPAVAYGAGVALDKLDGVIARTVGETTPIGRRLDMTFDTFGFVAAPLVAVLWGQLPVWYLSLSVARYAYRGGLAWRRHWGRPLHDEPDSDLGKYLAGMQMAFITVALTPAVPTDVVWTVAPIPLLLSLSVFARDFLVVTGRLSVRRGKDLPGP